MQVTGGRRAEVKKKKKKVSGSVDPAGEGDGVQVSALQGVWGKDWHFGIYEDPYKAQWT